jgi:AbrB family looped-hinge helix DNA binding protein
MVKLEIRYKLRKVRREIPFIMVNGIMNGMNLKIDRAGRIVVPKQIRQRLGLHPNTEIEIVEQADGVLLRPLEQKPSMVIGENGLWVHLGQIDANYDLNRLIDDVRGERIRDLLKV